MSIQGIQIVEVMVPGFVNPASFVLKTETGVLTNADTLDNLNSTDFVTTGQTGLFYPASNPLGFSSGVDSSNFVAIGQTGLFYPASNPSGFISGIDTSSFVTTGQTGNFSNASQLNGQAGYRSPNNDPTKPYWTVTTR